MAGSDEKYRMKNILLTGASGFIGGNLLPLLRRQFNVSAPGRAQLDLLDAGAVRRYLERGRFDAVIHLANTTAHNPVDKLEEHFERSLRVFTSLFHCSELYGKMLYLGSGAEYGKHRAIVRVLEEDFGEELPRDIYGLTRYIMSELALNRENIINLRLFACCGPGDYAFKLIPHVISCVRAGKPIALRRNALYDFLYVEDIAPVLIHFIMNEPRHKVYNLCSGQPALVAAIAAETQRQMGSELPIVFEFDGYGLEYTGDNRRLRAEIAGWQPRSIQESVKGILKDENR
jgi:GDP-L-fucose synthase